MLSKLLMKILQVYLLTQPTVTKLRYGVAGHWVQIIFSTLYQFFNCVCILVGSELFFPVHSKSINHFLTKYQ